MRQIKDAATLIDTLKGVWKSQENAFTRFENRIRAFMQVRNYSGSDITRYLCGGLLPRIVHSTYKNCYALLAQA